MRLFSLLYFILISFFFISCNPQKNISNNYIENATDTTAKNAVKIFEPVIQKNDLLSIQVYSSSTKPEVSDVLYNPPTLNTNASGHLVHLNANIRFPRIGAIHAEGLTKRQLADLVTSKITDLENPTVII